MTDFENFTCIECNKKFDLGLVIESCGGCYNPRLNNYKKLLEFVKEVSMHTSPGPNSSYDPFIEGWAKRVNEVGYAAEKLLNEIGES